MECNCNKKTLKTTVTTSCHVCGANCKNNIDSDEDNFRALLKELREKVKQLKEDKDQLQEDKRLLEAVTSPEFRKWLERNFWLQLVFFVGIFFHSGLTFWNVVLFSLALIVPTLINFLLCALAALFAYRK